MSKTVAALLRRISKQRYSFLGSIECLFLIDLVPSSSSLLYIEGLRPIVQHKCIAINCACSVSSSKLYIHIFNNNNIIISIFLFLLFWDLVISKIWFSFFKTFVQKSGKVYYMIIFLIGHDLNRASVIIVRRSGGGGVFIERAFTRHSGWLTQVGVVCTRSTNIQFFTVFECFVIASDLYI